MGTRGYRAYRHKGVYYRIYTNWDSYPSGGGDEFALTIPEDATQREGLHILKPSTNWSSVFAVAWIKQKIEDLEEIARRVESSSDEAKSFETESGEHYEVVNDNNWILPDIMIEWTYVIDLDNRAFTINGTLHFDLDNMPPDGISSFVRIDRSIDPIPKIYLKFDVSQWPKPSFNVDEALMTYEALQSLVVPMKEWGAPTWDTLSTSQCLSVELVKTIVSDYQVDLEVPEFTATHREISRICWKLACAAAPSHLLCPPEAAIPSRQIVYALAKPSNYREPIEHYVTGDHWMHIYCWFRGCLVTFCPRLDEEIYVKHEVAVMVERLRNHGRTSGMGIILSSYQMVAVSADGAHVRHSPALDIHNNVGKVSDGLLLLVHLLSPTISTPKTPWANVPAVQAAQINTVLPEEIIRLIVHMTDDETRHFVLPLVSRGIRSICLDHPRVGTHTLLGLGEENTYKVLCTSRPLTTETFAKLVRIRKDKASEGLAGSFQHHQTGREETDIRKALLARHRARIERTGQNWRFGPEDLEWKDVVQGELPAMRVQIVNGIWRMEVSSESWDSFELLEI